jgi:hypothetical protein
MQTGRDTCRDLVIQIRHGAYSHVWSSVCRASAQDHRPAQHWKPSGFLVGVIIINDVPGEVPSFPCESRTAVLSTGDNDDDDDGEERT